MIMLLGSNQLLGLIAKFRIELQSLKDLLICAIHIVIE